MKLKNKELLPPPCLNKAYLFKEKESERRGLGQKGTNSPG